MSNRREKEVRRERNSAGEGLGLPSNNVGIGGFTRSGRLSVKAACKCCAITMPCSSNTNKKPGESSGAAKRTAAAGVSESGPRKSGAQTVPSCVWKMRASVEVKHTAASLAQKEARVGAQEKAQVTRPPRNGKWPDPPAKKCAEKSASPQQVWREKAQPESTGRKELSARKQQSQPPAGTSKPSTKTTNPSPPTSKWKNSAIQKEVKRKGPSHKDQSSEGKKVQKKQAKYKASTSRLHLEPTSYNYHIEWDGIDGYENQIGICCSLCEKDLGVAPNDEGYNNTIPVVAILPCGHSFHNDCLNLGDLEGQQEEPPCIFCESFTSS